MTWHSLDWLSWPRQKTPLRVRWVVRDIAAAARHMEGIVPAVPLPGARASGAPAAVFPALQLSYPELKPPPQFPFSIQLLPQHRVLRVHHGTQPPHQFMLLLSSERAG